MKAYAKINLTLDILSRRQDGYHEISSVMQTVSLADEITVGINDGTDTVISCSDRNVPTDERNTCAKAISIIRSFTGFSKGVNVDIQKHIPSGAGLGGGSSDAAAVIRFLSEIIGISRQEQVKIAAMTGADVPFFLSGGASLCEGIGDLLTDIPAPDGLSVLLFKPEFGCSTPNIYKAFDEEDSHTGMSTENYIKTADIRNCANMLEKPACSLHPEIGDIKKEIYRMGADVALMSGSGSTVFGLFRDTNIAQKASKKLQQNSKNELCGVYSFIEQYN